MDRRQSVWNTLNLETAKLHASSSDITSDNRQKSSRRKKHITVSTKNINHSFILLMILRKQKNTKIKKNKKNENNKIYSHFLRHCVGL